LTQPSAAALRFAPLIKELQSAFATTQFRDELRRMTRHRSSRGGLLVKEMLAVRIRIA